MNPFEMVVMIVAIVTLGSIIRGKTHGKFDKRSHANMADQIEAKQLRSEMNDLKDRIAVLERLATDTHSAAALDREIDKLR
ncbi:MAG: hypothetical protein RLZ59_937 [Pseudomonadota bacterium]|jgi:cell division protein FtsB